MKQRQFRYKKLQIIIQDRDPTIINFDALVLEMFNNSMAASFRIPLHKSYFANTCHVFKVNRRGHIKSSSCQLPYFEHEHLSETQIYNKVKNLLPFL